MLKLSNIRHSLCKLACVGLTTMLLASCGGGMDGIGSTPDSQSDATLFTALLSPPLFSASSPPPSTSATASGAKYFGYALIDCGHDDPFDTSPKTNYVTEVAAFTNIAQMCVFSPNDNIVSRLNLMTKNGMTAMLSVQGIFFAGKPDASTGSGLKFTLLPDYKTRWTTFIQTNQLSQHTSQVGAFYVADEPGWNGISAEELQIAADTIKASFPTVVTTFVEAPGALSNLKVPTSIDVIGFDHYAIPDPETNSTFQSELTLLKSKRSRASQKIMLVMDAQWFPFYGAAGYPETYMATVATSYYNMAKSDPDVLGMMAYAWPGGLDDPAQKGTRDLPQSVIDEHMRIGKLITGK